MDHGGGPGAEHAHHGGGPRPGHRGHRRRRRRAGRGAEPAGAAQPGRRHEPELGERAGRRLPARGPGRRLRGGGAGGQRRRAVRRRAGVDRRRRGGRLVRRARSRGRFVSYGAAAGQPDPAAPSFGDLRRNNWTTSGFSISNLARGDAGAAGELIAAVFALVEGGLTLPAPRVVGWDQAIEAHIAQAEGRSPGKTVVAVRG
ncbi:zinc-binding dehydrogenase [Catenulispora yoronensis]